MPTVLPPEFKDYPDQNRAQSTNNTAPILSLVTVVRNAAKDLSITIESIRPENRGEIEYLIIDGASTDGTLAILEEQRSLIGYSRSEPDDGISDAFNKGICNALGSYIWLLNAGDRLLPGSVLALLQAIQCDPSAEVICGVTRYTKADGSTGFYQPRPDLLEKRMSVPHPAVIIKKSAYKKYGLFRKELKLAMDYDLLLRFKAVGAKFFVIETALTQMSPGGVSDQRWFKALAEVRKIKKQNLKGYNELDVPLAIEAIRHCYNRYFRRGKPKA